MVLVLTSYLLPAGRCFLINSINYCLYAKPLQLDYPDPGFSSSIDIFSADHMAVQGVEWSGEDQYRREQKQPPVAFFAHLRLTQCCRFPGLYFDS